MFWTKLFLFKWFYNVCTVDVHWNKIPAFSKRNFALWCLFHVWLCMIGWRQYSAETSPLRRGSSLRTWKWRSPMCCMSRQWKSLLIAYISPFEEQNEWGFRLIMFSFAPLLDCKVKRLDFHYSLTQQILGTCISINWKSNMWHVLHPSFKHLTPIFVWSSE